MTVTAVIVTNCTQRKSGGSRTDLVQLPHQHGVEQLAEAWRDFISRAPSIGPARTLYQGRSIADAGAAAAHLKSSWYVVSAGLGLISSDQSVPAYECTVAAGSELGDRLKLAGATSSDWWNALTSHAPQPLSRLITQSPTLLALPSSYLRMIHDDLAQVPASKAKQLRIFTSSAGTPFVPKHLSNCVMPYDERLESVPNYAGTRSDFAQRALRHFVEVLRATMLPLEEARTAVSTELERHLQRPRRPMGTRMSDNEIQLVLTAQWVEHAGSSTRLLRYLRDEAHISCEQKRFRRLWQELAAKFRELGGP